MTQILCAARRGRLFQASDRQLSFVDGPDVRPADLRANKALIVITGDSVALMGYSGTAFIDRYPTDDWLAGAVTSTPQGRWAEPTTHNNLHRLSIGEVWQHIEKCLRIHRARHLKRKMDNFWLEIQTVGYRVKRNRLVPFLRLQRFIGQTSAESDHVRPVDASILGTFVWPTPWIDTPGVFEQIKDHVSRSLDSPSDLLNSLGYGLELCSRRAGVGDVFLGIDLAPYNGKGYAEGHLVYRQDELDIAEAPTGDVPLFWTPWIVGPGHATQPEYISGGQEMFAPMQVRRSWQTFPPAGLLLKLPEPPQLGANRTIAMVSQHLPPQPFLGEGPRTNDHFRWSARTTHLEAGRHHLTMRKENSGYKSRRVPR